MPCKQDWRNEIQLTEHHCWWNQSGFQKLTENCYPSSSLQKQGNINTPEPMLFLLIYKINIVFWFTKGTHSLIHFPPLNYSKMTKHLTSDRFTSAWRTTSARFFPQVSWSLQNTNSLSRHPIPEKELQHKPQRVDRRWKEESKSFRLNKIALLGQEKGSCQQPGFYCLAMKQLGGAGICSRRCKGLHEVS